MEKGSHYYAVLALCRLLGMKKKIASQVAYSSEMVDDALIERVLFKEYPKNVELQKIGFNSGLDDCSTCPHIMTVWSYNQSKMMRTLVPFHFIPSCEGGDFNRRIRTHPDSPILKEFLENKYAMKSPFHLGIILHVLGDAYAHQGFSGVVSRGNRIRRFRINMETISGKGDRFLAKFIANYPKLHSKTLARILPMYSHSRVGTVPDLPSVEWSYEYDVAVKNQLPEFVPSGLIINSQRYKEAFEKFKILIEEFLKVFPDFGGEETENIEDADFFNHLVKNVSREDTDEFWKQYFLEHELFDTNDHDIVYNKHYWLENAFKNYKSRMNTKKIFKEAIPLNDFDRSDWYRYYLAQQDYKAEYHKSVAKYNVVNRKT